jgi:hypothetical protein
MKHLLWAASPLFVGIFLCSSLAGQRTGDMRDPDLRYDEGWTSLFDGKSFGKLVVVLEEGQDKVKRYFEDTAGQQSTFYIKDGLLMTTGTPNGYIRTSDVYDNYVFHVEVRYPSRGNSGVLVHIQRDAVWPKAIECQLYQSHMGRIFPIQGAYLAGGEMIHEASKPVGEWNTYEVYSEEGRLATVLNGVLIGMGQDANPRIGHIALQSEGVPAEFRNIKVRRHAPSHILWPKGEPAK